jgi:hypothetical protein
MFSAPSPQAVPTAHASGTHFDAEAKDCVLQARNQLTSVPLLRKRDLTKEMKIPSALSLYDDNRSAMEAHLAGVGIDYVRFSHTTEDQSTPHTQLVTICAQYHLRSSIQHVDSPKSTCSK